MVQRSDHTRPETAQLLHGFWAQAHRQRGIQSVVPETRHITPTSVWPVLLPQVSLLGLLVSV